MTTETKKKKRVYKAREGFTLGELAHLNMRGHKTMKTLRMIMMVRNMLFKAQNRKGRNK